MAEQVDLNLVSEAEESLYFAVDPFSPKADEPAPAPVEESFALDEELEPLDDVETLLKSLMGEDEGEEEEELALEKEDEEYSLELEGEPDAEGLDFELELEPVSPVEEMALDLGFDADDEPAEMEKARPPLMDSDAFDFLENDDGILPGASIVLLQEEEAPERETSWEEDQDHSKFVQYMLAKLKSIPAHSGQTTVGCEKAISYLRKLDKEISRAIQGDESNTINEEQAEKLRDKIHQYVDMLEDALDGLVSKKRRRKKKASFSLGKKVFARINDGSDIQYFISVFSSDEEERLFKVALEEPTDTQVQSFMDGADKSLTKEAGKLVTFVDPFLDSITRLLITSHIKQGKNLINVYSQLDEQYSFTEREKLSIHEILLQKGLGLNIDLGRLLEKDPAPMDGKNVEYSTEFYG